ncbi:MAG: FAD binding domain-containing protein, partial [Anaerolineae bacterium]|nr:FAD binding domain-containing protein [Anaerolineae bacterium]
MNLEVLLALAGRLPVQSQRLRGFEMWDHYYSPITVDEVLDLLARYGAEARLIGGGTDLIVEMKQGLRSPTVVIDVTRVP